MSLAHPEFLFLLLVPAILSGLYLLAARRRQRDLESFAARGVLPRLIPLENLRRMGAWRAVMALCAVLGVAGSLLGPLWGRQWQENTQQGASVIFALDTSRSMLAGDIAPSRLERAKSALAELVAGLRGDRVGLICFAGRSFLQVPPTSDYAAFAMALEAVDTGIIPRGGTVIASAIATAREAFKHDDSATKVLVLISDGENMEGDPVAAAKAAAKENIIIIAVGLGTPDGELVPVPGEQGGSVYLRDRAGRLVQSRLDEDLLRRVAQAGGGGYVRGTNLDLGLASLYRSTMRGVKKTSYQSRWEAQQVDHYQIPLLAAIVFLLAEVSLGRWGGARREDTTAA